MRFAYLYYLETHRTTAFIDGLLRESRIKALHVFDFSLLRAVFRGGRVSLREQIKRHAQKVNSSGQKLVVHVCPALSLGTSPLLSRASLFLSALIALLWSLTIPFTLLCGGIQQVLFYNGHPLYLVVFLFAKLFRLTLYTDLGDVLFLVDSENLWMRRLELAFLRSSRSIICVSGPFKSFLCREFAFEPSQVRVFSAAVPRSFVDAFDTDRNQTRRDALRKELNAGQGELILAYAGFRWFRPVAGRGTVDVQGVDDLCRAVEKLNDLGVPTRLVIIGAPTGDPSLKPFTQGPHGHCFHILGRYSALDEKHTRVLGGADFLCIPSVNSLIYRLYDRFKMYEYMAAGRPVVVAEGEINRRVFGSQAIYFPDGDTNGMVQAIAAHARTSFPVFVEELNSRCRDFYLWETRVENGLISKALFDKEAIEAW